LNLCHIINPWLKISNARIVLNEHGKQAEFESRIPGKAGYGTQRVVPYELTHIREWTCDVSERKNVSESGINKARRIIRQDAKPERSKAARLERKAQVILSSGERARKVAKVCGVLICGARGANQANNKQQA